MELWTLTAKVDGDPDIVLKFSDGISATVGRDDLKGRPYAEGVSTKHLEFRLCANDKSALVVIARSRFNVVLIEGNCLKKDSIDIVKNGADINLCGPYFPYMLCCQESEAIAMKSKKRKRDDVDSTVVSSTVPEKLSDVGIGIEMKAEKDDIGSRMLGAELQEAATMAIEDVLSAVYNRSHTAFANTKSLARGLLSSFNCDICLEVIAGCRSCVPCGHSFCVTCITNYMASKPRSTAVCPHCRGKIGSIIPNKTIDSAISDCLKSVKDASKAVAMARRSLMRNKSTLAGSDNKEAVPSTGNTNNSNSGQGSSSKASAGEMPPPFGGISAVSGAVAYRDEVHVTESQDIDAWEARYNENESTSKKAAPKQQVAAPLPAPIFRLARRVGQAQPYIQEIIDINDDDSDEDSDESDSEIAEGIDCSSAIVEHARSGRSKCIHCDQLIALGALRFGVLQMQEYHDSYHRFLHVTCGREFNNRRRAIGGNTISLLNMHSLNNLSNSDRRLVESSIL